MREYIAAVDEQLYLELVKVEANPLREMPLVGMNEPQKRRARQFAFMLTMHTKDRALQISCCLRVLFSAFASSAFVDLLIVFPPCLQTFALVALLLLFLFFLVMSLWRGPRDSCSATHFTGCFDHVPFQEKIEHSR